MPAQSPTLSPTLSAIVCRVTRIVLGNALLYLADEISADVGGLREDAATDTHETSRGVPHRSRKPSRTLGASPA